MRNGSRTPLVGLLALTALLGLTSPAQAAGRAKISAQSIIVNPVETKLDIQVWVNKDPSGQGNPVYRKGDPVRVGVKTNADAYVYLFNVNADGQIDLFFPTAMSPVRTARTTSCRAA